MSSFGNYRRSGAVRRMKTLPVRRAAPSSHLISLVLEHADLRDDMGGGRVMLRLSSDALADPGLRLQLGADFARARDVAVVWDEREDEIFRVLDGGAPAAAVIVADTDEDDADSFALTPKALAYLSAHGRRN